MRMLMGMCAVVLGLSGCATAFMGSPHVEGGRTGCEAKCRGQGMAVAGMVYMGEYSSACVCEVPGAGTAHATLLDSATAACGGAVVAVEMQRRQHQQAHGAGMRQY